MPYEYICFIFSATSCEYPIRVRWPYHFYSTPHDNVTEQQPQYGELHFIITIAYFLGGGLLIQLESENRITEWRTKTTRKENPTHSANHALTEQTWRLLERKISFKDEFLFISFIMMILHCLLTVIPECLSTVDSNKFSLYINVSVVYFIWKRKSLGWLNSINKHAHCNQCC